MSFIELKGLDVVTISRESLKILQEIWIKRGETVVKSYMGILNESDIAKSIMTFPLPFVESIRNHTNNITEKEITALLEVEFGLIVNGHSKDEV